jgi:hypothetical protein
MRNELVSNEVAVVILPWSIHSLLRNWKDFCKIKHWNFVLEGNATGQLAALIRKESKIDNFHCILRYDAGHFTVKIF